MSDLSREQIIAGLKQQYGVDQADAERAASRLLAGNDVPAAPQTPGATIGPSAVIPFPLRFTLPWTALVSDNKHYSPARSRTAQPILILRPEYRAAKAKTRAVVREMVSDASPVAFPLALEARVWVPDRRPGHDVANFAKCCHDALEGVVYVKDEWLYDIRWIRAGVDVDRPRAEITVSLHHAE